MPEDEPVVETVDKSAEVPFNIDDLHATATMLKEYIGDIFPAPDSDGKKHFGQVMMESAIEAIEFAEKWVEQHRHQVNVYQAECGRASEVVGWAQAVLTALNVGDVHKESPLHLKLREIMIAYRAAGEVQA